MICFNKNWMSLVFHLPILAQDVLAKTASSQTNTEYYLLLFFQTESSPVHHEDKET